MWYNAKDVMCILECGQTNAYSLISQMRSEIEQTKIPGTDRCYIAPPAGKIQKKYFCESMNLDQKECDRIIASKS